MFNSFGELLGIHLSRSHALWDSGRIEGDSQLELKPSEDPQRPLSRGLGADEDLKASCSLGTRDEAFLSEPIEDLPIQAFNHPADPLRPASLKLTQNRLQIDNHAASRHGRPSIPIGR